MSSAFRFLKLTFTRLMPLDWIIITISAGVIVFLVASSISREQWITIEFKVIPSPTYFPHNGDGDAPYWLADRIRPGDYQYDNVGKENLKILSIKKWGYQSKEIWVTASVKAKYKPKQKKYTYLYQPLEIGRTIDITINGSSIHGVVSGIEGFTDTRPTYTVTVKTRLVDSTSPYSLYTRGVEPWIANAITNKLVMYDAAGKPIAKILDSSIEPAQRVVPMADGSVAIAEDPIKKDVYMTIQLTVTKLDMNFMFLEDKPVLIGWSIPIFFDQIVLYPVITEIIQ